MRIDILSLFPEYFEGPFKVSMLRRAIERGLIDVRLTNIRDFGEGKHRKVDDKPYGGGAGMVLMPGPVLRAIDSVEREDSHVIYLSPQGKPLTTSVCERLAKMPHLILVCGHYEGIDERIIEKKVDEEICIGDYILTSGCPAAAVLIDATVRHIPGVLGREESAKYESFQCDLLEGPSYTRPDVFEGMVVPEVLKSGHHAEIGKWRLQRSKDKTESVRPDLCH
jgi:tRNA (guanine37-N1)-methyltransferase